MPDKPIPNRSVPSATIIPVLTYDDAGQAADWLCSVFGFTERLRIANHRVQLVFGDGAVIVTGRPTGQPDGSSSHSPTGHSIHVRVEDIDRHHERASAGGARILNPPTDYPYGERQYDAVDPGGHHWTFSQSIADVDPESWGATLPRKA